MGKGGKGVAESPSDAIKGTNVVYTISQVRESRRKLVVFGDNVYDISSWISKHPGGETVLKQYAGMDITDAFRAYHSKDGKAMKTLKTLRVGFVDRKITEEAGRHLHEFRDLMDIAEKTEFKTDYKHYYAIAIRLIVLLVMAIHLVVNKENQIVCIPPQKAINVDNINGGEDVFYEELIDGTMINLFYYKGEWIISTRTEIGGYNKWGQDKSFRVLFDESRDFSDDDLNTDYCYSFVMRHVENRNIAPIEKNELYIVEMYKLTEDSADPQLNRVMYEDYPACFSKVGRVRGKDKMIELLNLSQFIKGYTLKVNDKRYKIANQDFETIKKIHVNKNNPCLTYLELRKNGNMKEYLKYFPEKSARSSEITLCKLLNRN